ncbi:MAG: hypothetical protein IJW37_10690 [Lachnospiraceae bacterium]|nr:hypothetical protein [Lachnospiraceae bacterium]
MAKKASEKKVEEVKVTAVEETKAAVEAVAEAVVTEKKKPGRKPGSKNKTTEKATKKVEKPENQEVVYVQFAGEEFVVAEAMEKAKAAYVAEGHRASAIKSLRLYIKPEERKAYYVINDKAAGSIEL